MALNILALLVAVFFLTSVVGVVTGSNSLISVPVMFQVGIDPKIAIATNMFGLLFMSIGGTIPFVRSRTIEYSKLVPLLVITVFSSALGAFLVGVTSSENLKLIVSVAMIAVAAFSILNRQAGVSVETPAMPFALPLTYLLTFILGVYGGLFSGGYVTILTAVFVGISGMRYTEAIASTKLINVFSSGVATAIFMWKGLIDYKLGLILGVTMFVGAYVGAHFVTKMNDLWLRRIFVSVVFVLAVKTLYDFFWYRGLI